jgi:hypothetical protein
MSTDTKPGRHVGGEHVGGGSGFAESVPSAAGVRREAVHAHHRAGAGEISERLFHLVGIVGQLVDLRLVEHGGERVSTGIAGALARVAANLHRFGEFRDLQLDLAAVLSRAEAHLADISRLKACGLHVNGDPPRFERGERDVAARACFERRRFGR